MSINDLKYLSRYFQIDVISYIDFINTPMRVEYLRLLKENLPEVNFLEPVTHQILRRNFYKDKILPFISGIIRNVPYIISRYRNKEYANEIISALSSQKFHVFYIEGIQPSYVLWEINQAEKGIKTIYRVHDIIYETLSEYSKQLGINPTGLASRIDYKICKAYEKRLWRAVDILIPVTDRIKKSMEEEIPESKHKFVQLPLSISSKKYLNKKRNNTQNVLYIGTVHYPPNLHGLQWFLKECWPLVLNMNPDARLDIVGRGGEELLPVHKSVQIHGYVDDTTSFYQSADIFIVPLFAGSGIRLKIIDALNYGVPVVSTKLGYLGLELEEGKDILVADTAYTFARCVNDLFTNQSIWYNISRNGKKFIETHYSQQNTEKAIESIIALLES